MAAQLNANGIKPGNRIGANKMCQILVQTFVIQLRFPG
jgi:hypothetical protein